MERMTDEKVISRNECCQIIKMFLLDYQPTDYEYIDRSWKQGDFEIDKFKTTHSRINKEIEKFVDRWLEVEE